MTNTLRQTIVAQLEDKPGVLNRVTSLLRRRNYNIISLNVGRTHEPGISRMTLVLEGSDDEAGRITANLYKLVNVLSVQNLTHTQNVSRDLSLIKVRATAATRSAILELAEVFRARVVDLGSEALTLEVTGSQEKLDGLLPMLEPFGLLEMVQTGTVVMRRGPTSLVSQTLRPLAAE